VEKRGARYFFFASPEAHSIYPEKLPEDVQPAAERPIHQLIGHLEQNGSFARIIYPVDEVAEHKQRPVFPKTDSHWTDLGAFAGYRKLVGELASELGTIQALTFDDVVEWQEERPGDLGLKMRPVQTSPFVFLDVREPQARLTYDNRVASSGRRVEYECDAGERVCLIFGTSFTLHTLPFLAESFRRLVYVHLRTLDHSLVARERPDVVIGMSAERVMIQVPNDLTASTFEEVEAMKRARGTVMPPSKLKGNRLNYPG
jgi:alginate O-acetyltransferase complex protein AlgJ